MKPSDEQLDVIKNICEYNLIVEAVAGSGKTTTALLSAKEHSNKSFLLLTFNRKLSDETREKIDDWGLKNIQVYTYHKFASVLYSNVTKNNIILNDNLKNKKMKIKKNYDVLILDESQDMSHLYYKLITKFIKESGNKPLVTVMGDSRQSIYEFLDSDARYLSMSDKLFCSNESKWMRMKLSTTFRVNKEVANFINEAFFKEDFIKSNIEIPNSIEYIIYDPFSLQQYSENSTIEPTWYLEMKSKIELYGTDNVFILMNSPKAKPGTPASFLSNSLSKDGYDVYLKESDLVDISEEETKNKILISSFHGSKGLERKLVFIFGFDQGFYFHAKTSKEQLLPSNLLYVALTRSTEKLVMFGSFKNTLLPFLDKEKANKYITYSDLSERDINYFKSINKTNHIKIDDDIRSNFSISSLLEFLPTDDVIKLSKYYNISDCEYKVPDPISLNIKNKLEFNGKYGNIIENVSAINGSVLLAYYEYTKTNEVSLLSVLKKLIQRDKDIIASESAKRKKTILMFYENKINFLSDKKELSIEDMCFISTLIDAVAKETYYKFNQIKTYNWIDDKEAIKFKSYLQQFLTENTIQEEEVDLYIPWSKDMTFEEINNKYGNNKKFIQWLSTKESLSMFDKKIIKVHINGRIDLIDLNSNNVFEFKIKNELENIDYLQLLCYMAICDITTDLNQKNTNFYLVNISKNEHIKLNLNIEPINFLYELISSKMKSKNKHTDEDFLTINLDEKDD